MYGVNNYFGGGYGGFGMGGGNNIFGNLAAMNDMKLYQALNKRAGSSSSSVGGIGSTKPSSPGMSADTKSFIKQYQSHMTDMMDAANDLMSAGSKSVDASSSNTSVADADLTWKTATRAQYEIDVQQIATQQSNVSQGFEGAAANEVSSAGKFVISSSKGEVNINLADYADKGTNQEALEAAAKDINAGKIGVNAKVVVDENNKASLQLESTDTGANNGFTVLDRVGTFATDSGLSNVSKRAQDAIYTIDNERRTSSRNTIDLDGFKLEAKLKGVGKATITVGQDMEKTTSAVEDLISAYNGALKFLNNKSDMGSGVLKQMSNMLHLPVSEDSLKRVGITVSKDGTLNLDKDKFNKKMKESPDLTNSIISGSYSLAQGIMKDAKQGMSISSQKLIDNTQDFLSMPTGRSYSRSTFSSLLKNDSSLSMLDSLA